MHISIVETAMLLSTVQYYLVSVRSQHLLLCSAAVSQSQLVFCFFSFSPLPMNTAPSCGEAEVGGELNHLQ